MTEFVPVLATVVLISTLVTIVLGVLSYVAFRSREHRVPADAEGKPAKRFLVRHTLPDDEGS
jgi:hypothetical protein